MHFVTTGLQYVYYIVKWGGGLLMMQIITVTQVQEPSDRMVNLHVTEASWQHTALSEEEALTYSCLLVPNKRCFEDKSCTPVIIIFIAQNNNDTMGNDSRIHQHPDTCLNAVAVEVQSCTCHLQSWKLAHSLFLGNS
jgi:hypothetical protein